eukprot:jgi/Bigna1/83269/fgenesh1_pg.105_\
MIDFYMCAHTADVYFNTHVTIVYRARNLKSKLEDRIPENAVVPRHRRKLPPGSPSEKSGSGYVDGGRCDRKMAKKRSSNRVARSNGGASTVAAATHADDATSSTTTTSLFSPKYRLGADGKRIRLDSAGHTGDTEEGGRRESTNNSSNLEQSGHQESQGGQQPNSGPAEADRMQMQYDYEAVDRPDNEEGEGKEEQEEFYNSERNDEDIDAATEAASSEEQQQQQQQHYSDMAMAFDPYLFIKSLPTKPPVSHEQTALPRRTRKTPPVTLHRDDAELRVEVPR